MRLKSHKDLVVFKSAIQLALRIHELSKNFPSEEKYSLTDQIRRSSRSIAANIAEAFRKRRYPKAFISKLSDCEGEVAETQVWLYFIETFNYLDSSVTNDLDAQYEHLLAQLVTMIQSPEKWSM
jgi:four helix bundle protein